MDNPTDKSFNSIGGFDMRECENPGCECLDCKSNPCLCTHNKSEPFKDMSWERDSHNELLSFLYFHEKASNLSSKEES